MKVSEQDLPLSNLQSINNLHNLDEETLQRLTRLGKAIKLDNNKGDGAEFQMNDKVYLLVEGKAFLSCIGKDGKKVIVENLEKGDFFGHINLPQEQLYCPDCIFVEPLPKTSVSVLEFSKLEFYQTLLENTALSVDVLLDLSRRISKLEGKIEELTLYGLETRLLLELTRLGQPEKNDQGDIKVNPNITHEKLAQSTGTVRETVSKTLAKLKKIGVLFYDKNKNLMVNLFRRNKDKKTPMDTLPPHLME